MNFDLKDLFQLRTLTAAAVETLVRLHIDLVSVAAVELDHGHLMSKQSLSNRRQNLILRTLIDRTKRIQPKLIDQMMSMVAVGCCMRMSHLSWHRMILPMSMNCSGHLDWLGRKPVPLLRPVSCSDLGHSSSLAVAVGSQVSRKNQSAVAAAVAVVVAEAAASRQMTDCCHPWCCKQAIEGHKSFVGEDNLPPAEHAPVGSAGTEVEVAAAAAGCRLPDYRNRSQKLSMFLAVHLADHRRVNDALSAQALD